MTTSHNMCNDHGGFLLDDLLSQFSSSSESAIINNPYQSTFVTCNIIAMLCFIISSFTGNFSQVDKLWSIVPAMYAWMCVTDTRTTLMAFLATLWSVRLTYNFYRRGGYNGLPFGGEEDYRWEILRRGTLGGWWTLLTNKFILGVFNLVFISFFQNLLLLYIASPSVVAWSMAMKRTHCDNDEGVQNLSSLNALDGIAATIFLFALCIECMADNQQLRFQNKKHAINSVSGTFASATKSLIAKSAENKDLVDGFCQSGLFAIVRKPNYAAEQLIWISYYFFSVAASAPATWPHSQSQGTVLWVNWSMGGFILLCLLFQGSGWLTEQISTSKYPAYGDYQRRVPLYMPKITTLWNLLVGNGHEKGGKVQ
uniref:Steroid 5-alpha reductase C-terminal domain-containing protein n=1 Tax=Skeletonema marinoi TaxID=267567 RepID=A0A7S2LXH0_9STRA|mmetsp:Transcript_31713/g.53672  ORF Transcript_31713/g.53672 Transcript_31713/m.53672 type:complete len:368 (+) Transcript_31713:207-1310(+)